MPRKLDSLAFIETYCLIVFMTLVHCSSSMPPNASRLVSRRETCSYEGLLEDLELCSGKGDSLRRQREFCRELRNCYDSLSVRCHDNENAMRLVREHWAKIHLETGRLCRDVVSMETFQARDTCFRSFINTTVSCSDALGDYLEKFLSTENFRSACRLIGTVLNCFRDVLEHVQTGCDQEHRSTFHSLFIQPSLEAVRGTSASHCSRHLPPFSTFFSGSGEIRRTNPYLVAASFIFLVRHVMPEGRTY